MDGERVFSLSTVATLTDQTLRSVRAHVAKGALKIVRLGPAKRPRVLASELRRYQGIEKTDDRQ